MRNITLPPAASRSPYDPLTIRNTNTTEELTITADGTDTIDIYSVSQIKMGVHCAMTLQSNGVDAWFVIQDFRRAPTLTTAQLTSDLVVTQTPTLTPGTAITVTYPGLYLLEISTEITVVGVPGNQVWDLNLELYNVTSVSVIASQHWADIGGPLTNPRADFTDVINLTEAAVGSTMQLRVDRASATGTITLLGDGTESSSTTMSLTGPL